MLQTAVINYYFCLAGVCINSSTMSHVVAMSVNTQIEITWDRHHVTGYRPSIGSLTSPSAPKSPPVTPLCHLQRRLDNVSISSSGLSSITFGEILNSAASVASEGELVSENCGGSCDSWKCGKDASTFRSMRAESSTSFDLSINYSQVKCRLQCHSKQLNLLMQN